MCKMRDDVQRAVVAQSFQMYFGYYPPLTFKVSPFNGDPEHIITTRKYANIPDAIDGIAFFWRRRGQPAKVTFILN